VSYMALLTAFSFLQAEKKRKKDAAREPGRGTRESCRGSAAGGRRQGWRCAGGVPGGGCGPVGGIWYTLNQSINVHRIYCGVLWWCMIYFAPLRNCTGGGDAGGGAAGEPGGGTRGDCWQAIPPYRPDRLGRYRGLECRNFFSSFGSPCSAVLADSSRVSCCVRVDIKNGGQVTSLLI
jgi:hypothetical protein